MALDSYMLQNVDPLQSYLQGAQGIQTLQNNNQVMQQRQAAVEAAQQQQDAAQAAALQNQQLQMAIYDAPDQAARAKASAQYVLANPEHYKAVEEASKSMSDAQRSSVLGVATKVSSSLDSNNAPLGQQTLDDYVAGLQNSGAPDDQIAGAKFAQQLYKNDPKAAVTYLNTAAYALDPATYAANNKIGAETKKTGVETTNLQNEEQRTKQLHPIAVQQAGANVRKTEADIYASGAGILNDLAKLKLDKLKQVQDQNSVQLSDAAMKIQGGYIDSATTARSSASTAEGLANSYLTLDPLSTPAATFAEMTKRLSGNSDEISNLRKQYISFMNQGALQLLPPGAASENDMKRVLEGFPPENTNPKAMAQYLQSYSKVQKDAATANELKAEWISANGNLGRTSKDITMGETIVPAGTTFSRFLPLAMKNAAKTSTVASTSADPTARYAKYGQ